MKNRLERLFSRTAGQRRWMFGALIAGVTIVPLAIAGLFAGSLGSATSRVDTIPAIVVNNDTMVTTTAADGSKQMVLAGRQLVTGLTGSSSSGLKWSVSNSKDASAALAAGDAFAVVTIPKDFSKSILSISGADPKQAQLSIRTDDAHSYLAGTVAQSVGSAMTSSLGKQITTQYLDGLYGNLASMGAGLTKSANGAASLATGVTGLTTGLNQLSAGMASTASGAASLSSGIDGYTSGVDGLSSGVAQLSEKTASLGQLGSSTAAYASGTAQLASALASANAMLQSADPALAAQGKAMMASLIPQLSGATAQAVELAAGASQLGSVHDGIAQLAGGAAELAGGSAQLRSGASGLSDGISQLATGVSGTADGAAQVQAGADQLAAGMKTGAEQASALKDTNAKATAKVVADPVGFSVTRANPISSVGSVIGMLFVPIGLWIGALAILLLVRPLTATALASTASTRRLVAKGLGRAGGLALAQAIALTGLLHLSLGVSWTMIPATLAFSMLIALVFTAIHYLLTVAVGRVGIVVSLVLLALQLAAVTGLVPLQVVSAPFQMLSPLLPLTYAVAGMQGIVSGSGGAAVAGPAVALLLFAAISVVASLWVVARKRGARAFGFSLARSVL
ncbi:YhgE/Pip family protein [Rathayibacter soli]|uniref:YhgE/Pip family protein n=1 Tax=Rathayibacter soli TaxID=3144168 RepID=UPI0027E4FDEF|nr:YhgE/Pip family protein [Glaciibacter superstes]